MYKYVVSWAALEPARKKILKILKSFNQIIETLIRKSGVNIRVRNIIITRFCHPKISMVYKAKHYSRLRKLLCLASTFMVESVLRFLMGAILALKLCTSRRFDEILPGKKHNNSKSR